MQSKGGRSLAHGRIGHARLHHGEAGIRVEFEEAVEAV